MAGGVFSFKPERVAGCISLGTGFKGALICVTGAVFALACGSTREAKGSQARVITRKSVEKALSNGGRSRSEPATERFTCPSTTGSLLPNGMLFKLLEEVAYAGYVSQATAKHVRRTTELSIWTLRNQRFERVSRFAEVKTRVEAFAVSGHGHQPVMAWCGQVGEERSLGVRYGAVGFDSRRGRWTRPVVLASHGPMGASRCAVSLGPCGRIHRFERTTNRTRDHARPPPKTCGPEGGSPRCMRGFEGVAPVFARGVLRWRNRNRVTAVRGSLVSGRGVRTMPGPIVPQPGGCLEFASLGDAEAESGVLGHGISLGEGDPRHLIAEAVKEPFDGLMVLRGGALALGNGSELHVLKEDDSFGGYAWASITATRTVCAGGALVVELSWGREKQSFVVGDLPLGAPIRALFQLDSSNVVSTGHGVYFAEGNRVHRIWCQDGSAVTCPVNVAAPRAVGGS